MPKVEYIEMCPICRCKKMRVEPTVWKTANWLQEYPAYAVICTKCGDTTTVGCHTREEAIKMYNQLPRV
ncbi:hypothetical protein [Desulfovibrio sp. UCD-KL4C]|uniref:hypothetical protein n=1 Tax=Desulfovibrio sp. UCD-KL4C TaxID=2578120 RepID=UPI0025BABA7B|nr:hypothetical protein [Desulfovibrio sp. UCD-KL4C]